MIIQPNLYTMKRLKHALLLIPFLLGCQTAYVPQAPTPIVIDGKKQVQASLSSNMSESTAEVYYGLSDHFVVGANTILFNKHYSSVGADIGYFTKPGSTFRFLGLLGYRYVKGTDLFISTENHTERMNGHYHSFYTTLELREDFDDRLWSLGVRVGYFRPDITHVKYDCGVLQTTSMVRQSGYLIEPYYKKGWKVRFNLTFSASVSLALVQSNTSESYPRGIIDHGPIKIMGGVSYRFNLKPNK